jgi:hypothetical protein
MWKGAPHAASRSALPSRARSEHANARKAARPITTALKLMFVSSNWPRKKRSQSGGVSGLLKFNLD